MPSFGSSAPVQLPKNVGVGLVNGLASAAFRQTALKAGSVTPKLKFSVRNVC